MASPWTLAVLTFLVYLLALGIYRIYLSPIAHFPGSKLTALSGWYETYYDVFKGGQFTFRVEEWHKQYGSVIRINPTEIHISDPEFYDFVYTSSAPYNKLRAWRNRFGFPDGVQSTVEHDLHHHRRIALNPYFSKRRINDFAPYIQECAGRLCDKLLREYKGTPTIVTIDDAWAAFATDVVAYYVFASNYDFLSYADFVAPFTSSARGLALSAHFGWHFPWFLKLLQSMPDSAVAIINPLMRPVFQMQNEIRSQIIKIIKGENEGYKHVAHKTVFHDLLNSDMPAQEKSVSRLHQEGMSVIVAGTETTKSTLCLATFYILSNPRIRDRLRQALQPVYSDISKPPSLAQLEQIPYLTAIIQESLRMSYGVAQRLPRVSAQPVIYNSKFTIPPDTPFSMSIYLMHNDSRIFPDSHAFNPDRWLNNPRVPGNDSTQPHKPLTRYLVPFSKGTRICLGQHLAWAELYIGLASIFRRVELELFETGPEAVTMAREYFVPLPAASSEGVRVLVKDS